MRFYYIFIEAVCGFLAILPLMLLYQGVLLSKRKKRKGQPSLVHMAMLFVFTFALAGIFAATGVPNLQDLQYDPHVNLKFYFLSDGLTEQYFLNILLFVPFGFFLPLLWKKYRNFFWCVCSGMLFSIAIELAQLFNFRATDVEDVIMNTAGTVVGYGLLQVMRMMFSKTVNRFHSGEGGSGVKELVTCIAISWCGMFFLAPYVYTWVWGMFY